MPRPVRDEAQSVWVGVRLSPRERARLKEAAKTNSQRMSTFMRDAIEEAILDCLDPIEPEDEVSP